MINEAMIDLINDIIKNNKYQGEKNTGQRNPFCLKMLKLSKQKKGTQPVTRRLEDVHKTFSFWSQTHLVLVRNESRDDLV